MIMGLLGCSDNDDDGINCELYDPAFPTLYLKFVDVNGNNLIENGSIDPEVISVEGEFPHAGFIFNPASEFAVPNADIRQLDNTIQLFIPKESNFQYTIHLNDQDSILIDFTAELTRIPCDLSYYKPTGGVFKDVGFELTEVPPLQFLAVVELQ